MSTQQSNSNQSTGTAPTPTGENNAKPKNEQDNGGGTNKPPTKGKKNRNCKNKNRDKKSNSIPGINEYIPNTTFTDFKDRPIDMYRPVTNLGKFIETAASYLNKREHSDLADIVSSEKRPFIALKQSDFITVTDA